MKNMKMVTLKSVLFLIVSMFITSLTYAQAPVNFSGSWALNESKSNLGEGGGRMTSQKISITQDDKTFKLERAFTGQDGTERKMEETYTLDGKESVNPMFNSSKKSTAVWAADKKSLTVSSVMVFEMNGESNTIKTVEIYTLPAAGTLSIDSQSSSSMGERKATMVYDKK
jgi:hypothetical protein